MKIGVCPICKRTSIFFKAKPNKKGYEYYCNSCFMFLKKGELKGDSK